MKLWASVALLCLFSNAVLANETTQCKRGALVRTIEVTHEAGKPCDVLYTKEGQTDPTALWTYEHQTDQCAVKAKGFIQKLAGWGWTCSVVEAAATPPAAPAKPAK